MPKMRKNFEEKLLECAKWTADDPRQCPAWAALKDKLKRKVYPNKRKKQRKIYLNDEDYNKFIQNGGVKTLEILIHQGKFVLNFEYDEDGHVIM